MKNKKGFFKTQNGFWAETELDPRTQRSLGLLRPGHSVEALGLLARPTRQRSRSGRSAPTALWSARGSPGSRRCAHWLPPRRDR
jgi:hypothetical protein